MEHGAIGELIPEHGMLGRFTWQSYGDKTVVYETREANSLYEVASFLGERAIRLERVALFLTTEQS